LPQKIFGLHARQPQQFRNLVKGQRMLAIAFQSKRFKGAARQVATGGRKLLRDIVRNVECDFDILKINTHLRDYPTFLPLALSPRP